MRKIRILGIILITTLVLNGCINNTEYSVYLPKKLNHIKIGDDYEDVKKLINNNAKDWNIEYPSKNGILIHSINQRPNNYFHRYIFGFDKNDNLNQIKAFNYDTDKDLVDELYEFLNKKKFSIKEYIPKRYFYAESTDNSTANYFIGCRWEGKEGWVRYDLEFEIGKMRN